MLSVSEVWTHKTGLTPPLVFEVYEGSRDIERSCICVFGVLSLVLSLDCSDDVLFFILFVTIDALLIPSLGFPYILYLSAEASKTRQMCNTNVDIGECMFRMSSLSPPSDRI
jgi:hypothetical protein